MNAAPASHLVCPACGAVAPAPFAATCPAAGRGDLDHRLERRLDLARLRFPANPEPDPFVRFRQLTHAWQVATAAGMRDEAFVARVRRLEARIAAVDGHGFQSTPCLSAGRLAARLGCRALWVKDETGNVSGSHKGRHLMGLALALAVEEWLDGAAAPPRRDLAIASCGNAALAAAVVARALERPLTTFIPEDANPAVVARLESLGARNVVCARSNGAAGDPTLAAFRRAVAAGAVPFCCQASENGLTVEGGMTLAWELAATLAAAGDPPDRLFVQVGGGALMSACVQGLREAVALGVLPRLPRLHAVQTLGGHPLERAYRVLQRRILGAASGTDQDARAAEAMRDHPGAEQALRDAMHHRSQFMWPWETTPHSIAHGILDDETYDWHLPLAGMVESGGHPVLVGESDLVEAAALALETTGIPVDETGAAGLAGALVLARRGAIGADERNAVLFTGARRG